ncbi:MAG: tRNA pseudouridine(65) synthase TruC, partial [Myxococcales bacterium]|nr:tRNA pseudouridine(65) synthase TruC [Myxococcales bacterium]
MILHRDARCVVVEKPSGISTHRGWDGDDDALLQRARDAVGCHVYPVHRLDRG